MIRNVRLRDTLSSRFQDFSISREIQAVNIIEVKKIIEKSSIHIKETYFVKEIGIFGSFVKGKESTQSDIDILVAFVKGHKDFFNYMRLKYYLEELLKLKVDLVIKEAVKPRLKESIFNEVEYV